MEGKRILIKVSGEALNGDSLSIYDKTTMDHFCEEIDEIIQDGYQIAIVVGAGNLLRGRDADNWGIDRPDADEMGILFTVTNALMIRNKLNKRSLFPKVMTPMTIGGLTTLYNRKQAIKELEENSVVIFGGGIGNPFVSTDYTGVQRAIEIEADLLLMAKNVDGVYNMNPQMNNNAKRYQQVSYDTCVNKKIKVCDASAFILAEEFGLTMHLYDGNIKRGLVTILNGGNVGTVIKKDCPDIFYS